MIHQRVAFTFVTDASVTSAIYIGDAKKVAVELQTFSVGLSVSTSNITFLVAKTDTGTFRRMQAMGVYSGNSGVFDYEIPSSTGDRVYVVDPLIGFDHMKVESSKTATAVLAGAVHIWR